eukprot:Nitzschia sp. Nitz4//scaffold4_size323378//246052//247140//NITZ4_000696-RA/size323378-processed-gene-0.136-mRNA-1//1//CDS//3329553507//2986//frame0
MFRHSDRKNNSMPMEREPFDPILQDAIYDNNQVRPADHSAILSKTDSTKTYSCGSHFHEDDFLPELPPSPEPSYSVRKRILPTTLTALNSPTGRQYLLDAFHNNTAESYWALMEQFINQSEPAFCGVTTLQMVLNTMSVDPNVRWRGGWRFYGSEEVLLSRCCLSYERIRRMGVTLEEFRSLAQCQGLNVQMKRPYPETLDKPPQDTKRRCSLKLQRPDVAHSLREFENDIRKVLTTPDCNSILVASFSRAYLGQTGDGHFSPIAAYHEETHQVLVLDVARFKYAPYWVPVESLYKALQPKDSTTKRPRGWFVLDPPKKSASQVDCEDRRPAELVPMAGDADICPVGRIKVEFCKSNPERQG